MKQIVVLSILSVLIFSSCTKILDDELPQSEPKLVINAAINPDSVFNLNLSKTVHVFENESSNNLPFVFGATTRIYEDGQFLFNLEESENGYYSKPGFYPNLNSTYKVEVEKAGYNPVHAETYIPNPIAINSIDTLLVFNNEGYYSWVELQCILKYNDPPGVDNYYRLDCYYILVDEQGQEFMYRQYVSVDESDEYLFDKSYEYLLWNDLLSDGNEVNIRFNIYPDYYIPDSSNITYLIMLHSVSEDFYKYDKSRSLYFETGGSDNPFSEPVIIYSNIVNGFGVFGGYSSDTVSFQYQFDLQNK